MPVLRARGAIVAGLLEASPADEAAGEGGKGIVEFGAAFPADGEAFELVEEGEGLLDDVAEHPHVVQDTQREAMSHMDRLLRKRRPGRQ
ncbi:hypothetical protein ACFY91_06990 [Streptomyces albogriseolus]|uniref:hypothetical protein n=1 Tax=Streptomyces TaxID=1883 RepID=UPI00369C50D5